MTQERNRRLAAVFFADIVGYTDLSSRDEESALKVVEHLQHHARESVESRGGRIIKFVGDGAFALFDSADAALRSALNLQDSFSSSDLVEEKDLALRIGLHLGEVIEAEDGDVYGDGVNVASRVEGEAQPGQVVVSEDVHRLLRQQAEWSFTPFGPVELKGVEERMWLYVVGQAGADIALTQEPAPVLESSWIYDLVTKRWPQAAAAITLLVSTAKWLVEGLTTNGAVEAYLFAWAATTAGVWFLFNTAENAVAGPSRKQVAAWLLRADAGDAIRSIPRQFVTLFDRVFGERHLTLKCFARSSIASVGSVLVVFGIWFAWDVSVMLGWGVPPSVFLPNMLPKFGSGLLIAVLLNLIIDYVSLLETRWVLGRVAETGKLVSAMVIDGALTFMIAYAPYIWLISETEMWSTVYRAADIGATIGIISTFFTSVWLWLYAASVLVSRVLLKMNSGVGFLLRVTDVERQPFRSMGFVSVLITSLLFAAGLPLMLLG